MARLHHVRVRERSDRAKADLHRVSVARRGVAVRLRLGAAPLVLLALGPLVAFFATGYFSGFGAVTAEIFPTTIRGTAQGFTYNIGRIVSAAAPFTVGTLAQTQGFGDGAVDLVGGVRVGRSRLDMDSRNTRPGSDIRSGLRSEVSIC